jgi:radical SAM superfamily enzyme YgiQ (UPF0313 family)
MKILLINPRPTVTFWTFTESLDILGRPAHLPCLALATVAALTPADVEVRLIDDTFDEIDYDEDCDLVGITGYVTQASRMFEIADEFRRRGRLVAIGGPYATLSSSTVGPHADILFVGEAEQTWPAFIEDFRRGQWKSRYTNTESIDCTTSPTPRIDMLSSARYVGGMVQTSRGCPFECEFCDVITYVGRRQRHKTPAQVITELENLYQDGHRLVFLADDNLTANRGKAAGILSGIAAWNRTKTPRLSFITQMSIDIARPHSRDRELLDLASAAGLDIAFFGIETPNLAALKETKKRQNTQVDLVDAVQHVHNSGILVMAGMIVGFDNDTVECFEAQYEFAQQAGVSIISLSMLNAPESTPLEARLKIERRLGAAPMDDAYFSTNIIPLRMTRHELRAGTVWLLNKLYEPQGFLQRLAKAASDLPEKRDAGPQYGAAEGAMLLYRLRRSYRRLGPAYEDMPRRAARHLEQKSVGWLAFALVYYHHVVRMMQRHGIWDPSLADTELSEALERDPDRSQNGQLVEIGMAQ